MATSPGGQRLVQNIAANVRARRRAAGLTQAELAEGVGIDVRQLQYIESARSGPSYDVLATLAQVLDVSAPTLLEYARFVNPKRGRPKKDSTPSGRS